MISICRPAIAMLADTHTSEKSRRRNEPKVSLARAPRNVAKSLEPPSQTGADYSTGLAH